MKRLILAFLLVLSACGGADQPAPEPTPTATMAAERTLVASDFDPAAYGAMVEGPDGTEVESVATAAGKEIGQVTSYVACKTDGPVCDPATAPEGTVFTYVHRITLAAAPGGTPSPVPTALETPQVVEIGPTLFRTTRPATGFNLAVGYSRAEAEAALGDPEAIRVTIDRNELAWRVTGGTGWKPGATITVWWQGTAPPSGPQTAYSLEVDGKQADVRGPFPAEEKSAAN
ncbi:hypothetical protein [Tsuneonella sp. HG222]